MPTSQLMNLETYLRRLNLSSEKELTEDQLLSAFVTHQDREAFESIIRRHGNMVFGVCHRILQHQQDSEDAFQATFLVLFLKANSIHPRSSLPSWLYGVAYRTALKARAAARKRYQKEKEVSRTLSSETSPELSGETSVENLPGEIRSILDRELFALPQKYRQAIILCDLEGKSRKEAAERLQCKEGTMSGLLTRGRRKLAQRLKRCGFHLSVASIELMLIQQSAAISLPHSLLNQTIHLGRQIQPSTVLNSGTIPDSVLGLTKGMMKSMFLSNLRKGLIVAFTVSVSLFVGLATIIGQVNPAKPKPDSLKETKLLPKEWKVQNIYLAQDYHVLRELKCTLEQREKIEDILDALEEKSEAGNEKKIQWNNTPAEKKDPQLLFQLQQEAIKNNQDALAEIQKVLKPDQVRRLQQIDFQCQGINIFYNPLIGKFLHLSEQQQRDIQQSIDNHQTEFGKKIFAKIQIHPIFGDPMFVKKERKKQEKEWLQSIIQSLSEEQQTIWKEMIGQPLQKLPRTFP